MTVLKTLESLRRFSPVSRSPIAISAAISAAILVLTLSPGIARAHSDQIPPTETLGSTGDSALVAAPSAIPIANFSFESGTFVNDGNGTMVLPLGSTVMTGWTVVADQVAWIISPNPWGLSAQDGNRFLDLTAYPAGAPFGGVRQTLATSIGHTYKVNYYLGTYTARWGGPPVSILASAGGTSQTCTVSTTSTQSTWTLCSMSFTANSVSTTLSFVGTAGFQYIGLDNVSVEEIGQPGDFDGDGKSDLLLRNKATGQNIGWLMNGLTVSSSAFLTTIADTNWEVRGRGDFDGDGKADVLWRNKSTGENIGWLMNGFAISGFAFLPTIADTNWEIKGIGDLNGDGKADVLLRNRVTGQNIGWLMDGLTVLSSAFLPTIADTSWDIKGVGDFNGDGKADVILRNRITGQNIAWLMNGLTVSASAFLSTIGDTSWSIKGVGDFDGNGKADVLWRNKVTGQNIGWLMDGLSISAFAFLPTIADVNWEIKGVGDFNGDGRADVILRNRATGQNIGWLMNGLGVTNSAFMPTIADTNWDFVGQGIDPDEVTDNVITVTATAPDASEAGPTPATFRFDRTGDVSAAIGFLVARGGTAQESDYSGTGAGASFLVTIPAGQPSVDLTITPVRDNLVEGTETVVFTIKPSPYHTVGVPASATATIADDPPVVGIAATDPNAWEGVSASTTDPGVFTFTRNGGDVSSGLTVFFSRSGTASNGIDYVSIGDSVTIPANAISATVLVTPIFDAVPEGDESVVLTIAPNAGYTVGASSAATVIIHEGPAPPTVTITAVDPTASEVPLDTGTFRFTRTGSTTASLTVNYSITGTATNNVDYLLIPSSISIPAGQVSADLVITPIADGIPEGSETVALTLLATIDYVPGSPATATVTISDTSTGCTSGGGMANGAMHCGTISVPGGIDTWTFIANSGDRIAVNIGETADNNDFRPWIRLMAPSGALLGSTSGIAAAQIDGALAPTTGTYTVLVASFDSGFDGTGSYRLTMTHTPGPITVTPGDQGGPLTNGALHTGEILQGDLDVWTFTANVGDRIGINIGQITDTDDFRPWIRLWAPNGAILGSQSGTDAAVIDGAVAPTTGTYLVLVSSFDSGFDGTGTYRLTMTHTPGPITVSPGDDGGPLSNGGTHTGEILQGDLDVWTFTASAGDRIGLNIGEILEVDDFRPWIRLWAPNGAILGSTSGTDAAEIDGAVAPVTGTYLVLVSSFDSGFNGSGTYRLTMTSTQGPIIVSPGDQGGPLTNGALHTGEILQGDLDVWTFTANAGDRIGINIGEIAETDDFRPWIRLWAPNGAILGSQSGTDAAVIDGAVAPTTGTYLVLVSSFDSGFDGTGTYRLTMTHTPGPVTVSPGDEGGPLTNGFMHIGEILQGDLDVWTFTATAGDRIGINIGEIVETDDFRPWIRLWAPNGGILGSQSGTGAAAIDGAVAPVTGTYLVLVGSFDSGFNGSGTYRLTMTHTPGPITVSPGDEGGPMTNGALHTGEILRGDLDVWTFAANAGDRIGINIGQITETDDFRPWIRLWAPNGAILGSQSGTDAAVIDGALAPVTGTYLVLVSSFDSGFDGTGTYRLTMTHTPGPITVSPGDEGGAVTNPANGTILQGDLDVWTVTAIAGQHITVNISQTSETDDFRPWIRLWAPNGAILGSQSGLDAAQINNAVAPATGTYLILVSSFDSGFNGTGTYQLTVNVTP